MKICHITTVHKPFDTRIYYKECLSLMMAGYDVKIIAPHDKKEIINKIEILPIPKPRNRFYRMFLLPFIALRTALKYEASLYHLHDPELLFIGLILKSLGKKVIYDIHENYFEDILTSDTKEWIPKSFKYIVSNFYKKLEIFIAKKIDALIAATPNIYDNFSKVNNNTIYVCNYPDVEELNKIPTDWSRKENAACYIGRISENRGIFKIIEAISKIDIKLLLAGEFSNKLQRKKVSEMDGWQKVIEFGYVHRGEIINILSKAKVGLVILYPIKSYIESLPIKMFEYLAAGIPVIASNFPLWKKIIEDNHCGICVDPYDVTAIAAAMNWIITHPKESYDMGMRGRELVLKKFNWDTEKIKLLNLYNQLLQTT